jgi:uncharacterized paraquat-inducible protein A
VDVALALLVVITLAAVLAVVPVSRRRRPPAALSPPPAPRPRQGSVLGVCAGCLEIVEATASTTSCPACGGELQLQRRIVERPPWAAPIPR